ncbi:hypothetical protein DCS_08051 [Drechmeria coniospora]|uniref:Uncharacterized protein n=1 Tax=Drechmeria coniospora TaxID=98403 RepID=A0A151GG61_DRECN|nr:hypothetical protein DCS_08051 [Drechmeria coniospora]KYK56085.1 hypothetical protein DCS_08051 [Drechmeria coniospora]ODA77763.1 hypothetical protein RJ55_06365 [Drechmeria coniospora]
MRSGKMHQCLLATLASLAVAAARPGEFQPWHVWCNTLNTNDVDQTCYCNKYWEAGWNGTDDVYQYSIGMELKTQEHLDSASNLFAGIENAVRTGQSSFSANVKALYQRTEQTRKMTVEVSGMEGRDWPELYRVGAIRAFRRGTYERGRLVGNMKWYIRSDTKYWKWTPEECWSDKKCGEFNQCPYDEGGYMSIGVGEQV